MTKRIGVDERIGRSVGTKMGSYVLAVTWTCWSFCEGGVVTQADRQKIRGCCLLRSPLLSLVSSISQKTPHGVNAVVALPDGRTYDAFFPLFHRHSAFLR